MLIGRQLRIALLISLLWHLFWMTSVSIVFLPSGLKLKQYSSVYFLGSILRDSISFAQAPLDRKPFSNGAGQVPHADKKHFAELPSEADIRGISHFTPLEIINPLEAKFLTGFSEKPYVSLPVKRDTLNPDSFIDVDTRQRPGFSGLSSEAQAEVGTATQRDSSLLQNRPSPSRSGGREIIFQPPISEYPEWIDSREFKGSSVVFKIYISADGLVQEITNVQLSGNPEMDAALARYIRRWRFAPIFSLPGQWQTIKIKLDFNDKT